MNKSTLIIALLIAVAVSLPVGVIVGINLGRYKLGQIPELEKEISRLKSKSSQLELTNIKLTEKLTKSYENNSKASVKDRKHEGSAESTNYITKEEHQKHTITLNFEQKGYFKKDSLSLSGSQRIFTYTIKSEPKIKTDKLDSTIWEQIIRHGKKQMTSDNYMTWVFYYTDGKNTPADKITLAGCLEVAMDRAYYGKPLALVQKDNNGEWYLIGYPEQNGEFTKNLGK